MATARFRQDGNSIDYTAAADVKFGDVVVLGSRVGIAGSDIKKGETGALIMEGVFEIPKAADAAIDAGAEVYFSADNGTASTTNTDTDAGYAVEAAAAADTFVRVKLRG